MLSYNTALSKQPFCNFICTVAPNFRILQNLRYPSSSSPLFNLIKHPSFFLQVWECEGTQRNNIGLLSSSKSDTVSRITIDCCYRYIYCVELGDAPIGQTNTKPVYEVSAPSLLKFQSFHSYNCRNKIKKRNGKRGKRIHTVRTVLISDIKLYKTQAKKDTPNTHSHER